MAADGTGVGTEGENLPSGALLSQPLALIEQYFEDVIWVFDTVSQKFIYISPSVFALRGFTPAEVLQQGLNEALTPESLDRVTELIQKNRVYLQAGKIPPPATLEIDQLCKDGRTVSTEATIYYHKTPGGSIQVIGVSRDITQRKLDETQRDVIYRIAEAAHAMDSLPGLYAEIHAQIGRVMQAKNFYIALYDEETDLLSFVYEVDERDAPNAVPMQLGKGLTAMVIRSGKSHIFQPDGADKQIEVIGARSRSWLGAPLILEGKTIGVMAVQSYTDMQAYGEREQKVLDYVANTVALAIQQVTLAEQVRVAERRNQALIMNAPDGIIVTDGHGHFIFASPTAFQIFGYDPGEMSGLFADDVTHPDDLPRVKQAMAQVFADPAHPVVIEYRGLHKDGNYRWIHATITNLMTDPAVRGLVINFNDITARREDARVIQKINERYELIAENSVDVIWVLNVATMDFPYFSPSIRKLTGWTNEELEGLTVERVITPESMLIAQKAIDESIPRVLAGEDLPPLNLELDEYIKGGGTVPIEVTARFVLRPDGSVQVVGISRDITERRKRALQLKEAQENLEKAQSAAHMGSWEFGVGAAQPSWSREMFQLFEIEPGQAVPDRQTLEKMVHPDDLEKLAETARLALTTGQPHSMVFRAKTGRGNERVFEVSIYTDPVPLEEINHIHGTIFDVTEKHQARERIARSEETMRAMVDATLESVLMLSLDGTVLMANEFTARRMGVSYTDLLGQNVYKFFPPELAKQRKGLVQQVIDTGQPLTFEDQRGELFFLNNVYPVINAAGKVERVVVYGRDVTQARHALKRIQESEALLIEAQHMAHIGNWAMDITHDTIHWSDEIFRILDMQPGRITPTGKSFLDFIHPEDRPVAEEAYEAALRDPRKQELIERIITCTGAIKYVYEQWQTEFENGKPVRAMGTVQDITEQVNSENARRQEKNKLEKIAATVPGVIFEYRLLRGGKSYLSYVSPRIEELYGLDPEKLSRSLASAMKPMDRDDLRRFNRELIRSARRQQPLRSEFRYNHPTRGQLWLELDASPTRDADGNYTYYGIITDITARKQSELELQQYNEDLALVNRLVEAMNRGESIKEISRIMAHHVRQEFGINAVALYLMDEDGQYLRSTSFSTGTNIIEKIEKMMKRPLPDVKIPLLEGGVFLKALQSGTAVVWDSPDEIANRILEIIETDTTSPAQKALYRGLLPQFVKLVGSTHLLSYPLVLDDQTLGLLDFASQEPFSARDKQRLINIGSSLTSAIIRQQVLTRMKESNDRFALIARNIHEVFWLTNRLTGKLEYLGPRFETIFGYDLQLVQGDPMFHLRNTHPDDRHILEEGQKDIEAGRRTDLQFRFIRPDGREAWLRETSEPIFNERGKLVQTVGVTADITEAKLAELTLKQREGLLGSIVSSSPGDILRIGLDGKYLYSNKRWHNQSDSEFRAIRFVDQVAGDQAEQAARLIQQVIRQKTSQHMELLMLTESGEYHWNDVVFSPVVLDDRVESVTIFKYDIHERKEAEIALAASEARYKSLSAELEARVAERTAEVQDLYDNAPTGYHSIDLSGRMVMVNQTECNWLGYTREELLNNVYIRDLLTPASRAVFDKAYPQYLKDGFLHDVELEFLCKDGSILPVVVNTVAVYDADGKYRQSRSTLFNNTEQKKAQLALMESQASLRKNRDQLSAANAALEKASRLKDEFLASMSHELRTPLTGILGLSEALQLETYGSLSDRQRNALVNIESSGRHLLDLINDILDLSKIEAEKLDLNLELCPVVDTCQASLQLTRGMAQKKNLSVDFKANPANAVIRADPRRLKQMLVNLLSNAIKFTPEGGKLGLEVAGDAENQHINLTVWDKGIGIHPEDMEKLFKPFVQLDNSLSRAHSGTGLGLSLVGRLAEMHGGSVRVESVFGEGSRFTITLPWNMESQPAAVVDGQGVEAIHRCLLIEDNVLHQRQIGGYLQTLGIEYFMHDHGRGALDVAVRVAPDAILLDLNLPDIQGEQVLLDLKSDERTRDMVVIISSVEEDRRRYLELGAAGYLVKPFSADDLKREFTTALAKKPALAAGKKISGEMVTVIFADDNPVILDTTCDNLRVRGYNVITARNGRELVQLAPNAHAHIILTDIQMPGMDGLQAIQAIRSSNDAYLKQVPIVAITALAMPGDEQICLAAGANRYVSKPVPFGKMLEIIEELRLK
jgi:PAS domain S-box-containing protein